MVTKPSGGGSFLLVSVTEWKFLLQSNIRMSETEHAINCQSNMINYMINHHGKGNGGIQYGADEVELFYMELRDC